MRRFFCEEIPPVGGLAELSGEDARHLRTVLRDAGGTVGLVDGEGCTALAQLTDSGDRRRALLRITERHMQPQPARRLHLYVAPPRAKLMAQVVRQAAELGVWAIQPVITSRSIAEPDGESAAWVMQAREACKQSGNPWMPRLHAPVTFSQAVAAAPPGWYGAPRRDLAAAPAPATPSGPDRAVWIGPEGGFTDQEIRLIAASASPIAVGDWVLRIETAVVALIAIALHLESSP